MCGLPNSLGCVATNTHSQGNLINIRFFLKLNITLGRFLNILSSGMISALSGGVT